MDTNPANRKKNETDWDGSESRALSSSRVKSLQLNKRSKNDNGEGISTLITLACCIVIILVFFFILGIIINAYTSGSDKGDQIKSKNQEPGATGSWSNTCTANSFLLNDGVCDDITNTVECHFDLGDCCLEDKDLKYCLDCSCKLNFDKEKLQSQMVASNVGEFKFDRHLLETGYVKKSIENVDSIVTCSKICFNNLSGWTLTETGICKCMDFPSKFCYPPLFNNKTDIPETNSTDLKFLIDQSKTTVLLSCSEPKLLVAMGTDYANRFAEVLDVMRMNNTCAEIPGMGIPSFDIPARYSTGGLLFGSIPLYCGGMDATGVSSEYCFTALTNHKSIVVMPEKRVWGASIVIGNHDSHLFIAGGYGSSMEAILDSTLLVSPFDNVTQYGTQMPFKVGGHCFVKVSAGLAIAIGGRKSSNQPASSTLYYNIREEVWLDGPQLNVNRAGHACGVVQDSKIPSKMLVVVATGVSNYNHICTVEVLDVVTDKWTMMAKPFPVLSNSAALAPLSMFELVFHIPVFDDMFLISEIPHENKQETKSKYTYKLRCFNGQCLWTEIQLTTELIRKSSVVMLVPEHLVTCDIVNHFDTFGCQEKENLLGNGECDQIFETSDCFYDGGDCSYETTTNEVHASENCFKKGGLGGVPIVITRYKNGASGPIDCQQQCQEFNDCDAFVFRTYDGRCHFVRHQAGMVYNGDKEEFLISGPEECQPLSSTTSTSPSPAIDYDKCFIAGGVGGIAVSIKVESYVTSPKLCQILCRHEPNCGAFRWDSASYLCEFFESHPELLFTGSDPGKLVSGPPECTNHDETLIAN